MKNDQSILFPEEELNIRLSILEKLVYPKEFHKKLVLLMKLFLPCDYYRASFINALEVASFLNINREDSSSQWTDIVQYFTHQNEESELGKRGIDWPRYSPGEMPFAYLLTEFRKTISHDNYKYIEISEKSLQGNRSNYATSQKETIELEHVENITDILVSVFLETYNNSVISFNRHREDCRIFKRIISRLLYNPNNIFRHNKNSPRIELAIYLNNLLNNLPPILFEEYSAYNPYTKDSSIKRDTEKEWIKWIKRAICILIGNANTYPDILQQYTGCMIGTPIKHQSARNCINTDEKTRISTKINSINTDLVSVQFENPFRTVFPQKKTKENTHFSNNVFIASNHSSLPTNLVTSTNHNPRKYSHIKVPPIFSGSKYLFVRADVQHLPIGIAIEYLLELFKADKLHFAYCWLCLFTGIGWKRLENLIKSSNTMLLSNKNVIFDTERHELTYSIIDGATYFCNQARKNDNNLTHLKLPTSITNILLQCDSNEPFIETREHLKSIEKSYRKSHGGITPTPERLNATFKYTISKFGISRLESCSIRGEVEFSEKARIKYLSITIQELNKNYKQCLNLFNKHLNETHNITDFYNFIYIENDNTSENIMIGSQVSCEITSFIPLIRTIKNTITKYSLRKALTIVQRVNHLQTVHIYYYLMLQLLQGLRPIGNQTEINLISDEILKIKQKNSASFYEAAYQPVCSTVLEQLQSSKDHSSTVCLFFEKRQYKIINKELIDSLYPLRIHLDINQKTLTLYKLESIDFFYLIEKMNFSHLIPGNIKRNNIFRHALYTYLHKYLSESFQREFFQHHVGVINLLSPYSSTNFKHYEKIRVILDELAIKLGFRVIQ